MVDFRGPRDQGLSDAYPWVLAAGALVSLVWLGFVSKIDLRRGESNSNRMARIDSGLVALLCGLIAARLGYVATHWTYFSERPAEIIYYWDGGLSWAAGAVGVLVGLAIYVALTHRSFWQDADALAIPAAILAAAAWTGCLLDRCAYGQRTASGFLTPPAPDMLGNVAPRWPTQALGGLLALILVGGLYWAWQLDLRPGLLAALSLSLIAAIALALSFTRGDPMPAIAGLRVDGLGAGAILLLGLGAMTVRIRR